MPIELSGSEFEADFLEQMPAVEKALIAHGFDPSAFFVTKSPNGTYRPYSLGVRYYDYTVAVGDESFTVTYPGDLSFLEFFLARCVAVDDADKPLPPDHKPSAAIGGLARWLIELRR